MTQKIYDKLKKFYDHTVNSEQFRDWHNNIRVPAWNFYDGHQWTDDELAVLQERGQAPTVINHIKTRVDSVIGLGLQNMTKVAYTPRNFTEDSLRLSEAATAVAYQIQDYNDAKALMSQAFKDQMVSGLGCIKVSQVDEITRMQYIPDGEVIWDVDDTSPQLTNSRYRGQVVWMDIDVAKKKFPSSASDIDELVASAKENDGVPQETTSGLGIQTDDVDPYQDFVDVKLNKIRIVELQYKKATDAYIYTDTEGNSKRVFDKKTAEDNKSEGTEVLTVLADEIWVGYFTQDILLGHLPLPVQSEEFEYVFSVWNRRRSDDVPYGAVYSALDPQRVYNKSLSKRLHILATSRVIADADAVDDIETLRHEAARPDGIILKKAGKEVRIDENRQMASDQLQQMQQSLIELGQAMGVPEELLGAQSNATSGVAIRQRQMASALKQAPAFDAMRQLQKKIGVILLGHIQSMGPNRVAQIINPDNPEEAQVIPFNITYELDGKTVTAFDISTMEFSVAVVEEPDYTAPPEELAQNLTQMTMNGQLEIILNMPTIAKQLGIRNVDQVQKEYAAYQAMVQQRAAMQNAASPDMGAAQGQTGGQQPATQQPSPLLGG